MNAKRFTCFFRGGHQWVRVRYPGAEDAPDAFFLRCSRCRHEDTKASGAVQAHPGWGG